MPITDSGKERRELFDDLKRISESREMQPSTLTNDSLDFQAIPGKFVKPEVFKRQSKIFSKM